MKKNDGQPSLRANIANKLAEAGMSQLQAEQEASRRLLQLREKKPGTYEEHAGDTVIVVTSKKVKDETIGGTQYADKVTVIS